MSCLTTALKFHLTGYCHVTEGQFCHINFFKVTMVVPFQNSMQIQYCIPISQTKILITIFKLVSKPKPWRLHFQVYIWRIITLKFSQIRNIDLRSELSRSMVTDASEVDHQDGVKMVTITLCHSASPKTGSTKKLKKNKKGSQKMSCCSFPRSFEFSPEVGNCALFFLGLSSPVLLLRADIAGYLRAIRTSSALLVVLSIHLGFQQ